MLSELEQGIFYAVGLLAHYCGEPTHAAFILKEAGLAEADVSDLDDFDKCNLKSLRGEKGIKLKGL
jgi:hypothetical protein